MAVMFKWFESTGYAADIKSLGRDFPELKWHTFEKWAGQQEWGVLDKRCTTTCDFSLGMAALRQQ